MLKQFWCAALLLCGCSALAAPPPVTLKVGIPSPIALPDQGKVELHVELVLTNPTAAAVTVTGSNRCVTHTWRVTDDQGNVVDDRSMCPMIYMPQEQMLAPGDWRSDDGIVVDAAKYTDGGHYVLHYTFWGVSADAAFTVTKR